MKNNLKTRTDELFEKYLKQEGYQYKYEPFSHKSTIPDYLFYKDNIKVLIECEEVEKIPLDHVRPGAGSLDMNRYIETLRDKIYIASKQLKPYKDEVSYEVIIIGKKSGYDLDLNFLKWAMWGDPVIRIPIDLTGNQRYKAYFDMKVKGALRKNDPMTKEMKFHAKYISGIGLIKEFNGLSYYKNLLYNKYIKTKKESNIKVIYNQVMEFFNKSWQKYRKEIPNEFYNNPNKIAYKIEIVGNPFALHPLPKNIFKGIWDLYFTPTVIYSRNLK